jgi:hypothetical protein
MDEPMEYVFVDDRLRDEGLFMVDLRVLHPDAQLYSAALLQPTENIQVMPEFIKNRNNISAEQKHNEFLNLASREAVDLAITPEYSCPWNVLDQILQNEIFPHEGKLWILGCESIQPAELLSFIERHHEIVWIYDEPAPQVGKKFLDIVCCLFNAKNAKNQIKRVISVQLKSQPMADTHYYIERDNLITGSVRYIFRNSGNSIYLAVIICSDALSFLVRELPFALHIPYLIIHIQLNPQPFHNAFKLYRQIEFITSGDRKELFTVNWARGVQIEQLPQHEHGGSAFYTKATKLNLTDERINENHTKGLYYSMCVQQHSHIYFPESTDKN